MTERTAADRRGHGAHLTELAGMRVAYDGMTLYLSTGALALPHLDLIAASIIALEPVTAPSRARTLADYDRARAERDGQGGGGLSARSGVDGASSPGGRLQPAA